MITSKRRHALSTRVLLIELVTEDQTVLHGLPGLAQAGAPRAETLSDKALACPIELSHALSTRLIS